MSTATAVTELEALQAGWIYMIASTDLRVKNLLGEFEFMQAQFPNDSAFQEFKKEVDLFRRDLHHAFWGFKTCPIRSSR
jgi:hypothetical protein